jgi:LmbE family N-acetylglucosaminyl deacetylase
LIELKEYQLKKVKPVSGKKSASVMSILAVGPHPDDIEFGCAATLHKYIQSGHQVTMLVMTRGGVGGDSDTREKELIASAKILGVSTVFIAPFEDTKIPVTKEVISSIESVVESVNPSMVFVNYPNDTHQDHRTTTNCVVSATRYVKNLLYFEVPSTQNFMPDIFVDIEQHMDIKRKALLAHESQVNKVNIADLTILECTEANAIFRGMQGKVRQAEAFKAQRLFINI